MRSWNAETEDEGNTAHPDIVGCQRVVQDVDDKYNRDGGQRTPAQDPIEGRFQGKADYSEIVISNLYRNTMAIASRTGAANIPENSQNR